MSPRAHGGSMIAGWRASWGLECISRPACIARIGGSPKLARLPAWLAGWLGSLAAARMSLAGDIVCLAAAAAAAQSALLYSAPLFPPLRFPSLPFESSFSPLAARCSLYLFVRRQPGCSVGVAPQCAPLATLAIRPQFAPTPVSPNES